MPSPTMVGPLRVVPQPDKFTMVIVSFPAFGPPFDWTSVMKPWMKPITLTGTGVALDPVVGEVGPEL